MFTDDTVKDVEATAAEFGIEPAALLAIAEIESGGRAFTVVDGRSEPLIRFEGHYFDRRLSGDKRETARRLGIASPQAGAVANPASQAARWRIVDQAEKIDRKAAYESVSWGLGQVMGAHWLWLGFGNVDDMVAAARSGAAGQARLIALYLIKAGLAEALRQRDWPAVARGYNGPGYKANAYDTRLAEAFARHARTGGVPSPAKTSLLRRGDRGEAVAALQRALSAAGYPVAADGVFGPMTAAAVLRFQREHGLEGDGIAGPLTMSALGRILPAPFAWLRDLLRRAFAWLPGKAE